MVNGPALPPLPPSDSLQNTDSGGGAVLLPFSKPPNPQRESTVGEPEYIMEKVNYRIAQWVSRFIQPYLSDVISIPLSKRPEAVAFAKAYNRDKTLRGCIGDAVALTPGADEYQKVEEVYNLVRGVLEFIFNNLDDQSAKQLSARLNAIKIPDGDADPSNDTGLGELFNDIMLEVEQKA